VISQGENKMGRPLNKKYFGNRNIGSVSTTTDDNIGGESVASVTIGTPSSYTTRATVTFDAPTIPNGVTALGTVTSEVLSAAISGSQTRAYPVTAGAISLAGGTTAATFTATVTSSALSAVAYASATTISFSTTTTAMISGTSIHITGASITGTMTIGGVAIAAGQIYYVGAPTSATAATLYATYADAVAATNPLTISNGSVTGATFTRGVTFGTVTALTVVTRGEYEALVGVGAAVVAGGASGAGLAITQTYRAKAVVITEGGSGYTTSADAAPTFTQSVAGTSVLSTDSGDIRSATNEENAILMTARLTGGSAVTVDIIKQVSKNRFKVTDGVRTGIVKLKSSVATAAGEASIRLLDTTGTDTYFATKITSRKVTITRGTGTDAAFVTGTQVKWNMTAATADSLLIDNA
jgi:hypothetical protein